MPYDGCQPGADNVGEARHQRELDADVKALTELKTFLQHTAPKYAGRAQQIFGTLSNWNQFRVCLQEVLDGPNHLRDANRVYDRADELGLMPHQANHVRKILQHAVAHQKPLAESTVAYLDSGEADLADDRDRLDRINRYARGGSPEQASYAREMAEMQRTIRTATIAADHGITLERAQQLLS
jgi:hypothetical protein